MLLDKKYSQKFQKTTINVFSVYLCEFLGIGQIVNSNGQEDVEQCICGGVKETLTETDGLWRGSNEEMEGGDEDIMCVFFTKPKYILRMFVVVLILQDTVAKKCEDNEEYGEDHPFVIHSSLGLNAIIHHHVPVFSRQNLKCNTYKLHLRSEELKWLPLAFILFLTLLPMWLESGAAPSQPAWTPN